MQATFLGIDVREARERVACLRPREREAMALIAEGWDAHETSVRMGISRRTLEVHRLNCMNRLVRPGEPRTVVRAVLVYLAGTLGVVK